MLWLIIKNNDSKGCGCLLKATEWSNSVARFITVNWNRNFYLVNGCTSFLGSKDLKNIKKATKIYKYQINGHSLILYSFNKFLELFGPFGCKRSVLLKNFKYFNYSNPDGTPCMSCTIAYKKLSNNGILLYSGLKPAWPET